MDPRLEAHETLAGANARTGRFPSDAQRELLWQWARLETVFTSLRGARLYNVSFDLLDSYIKFDGLNESLSEQITVFKYAIMEEALRHDHGGDLEQALQSDSGYAQYIAPLGLLPEIPQTRKEAAKALIDHRDAVDRAFNVVKSFLGLPF